MKILAGEFLFLGITAALATGKCHRNNHIFKVITNLKSLHECELNFFSGDPDQSLHARLGVWNQLFSNYNAQLHPENVTVQLGIDLLHVDLVSQLCLKLCPF